MDNSYSVDLKVYQRFPEHEVLFRMPVEVVTDGWILPGIYTIQMDISESQMDMFVDWSFRQPELKVIGVTKNNKTPKK